MCTKAISIVNFLSHKNVLQITNSVRLSNSSERERVYQTTCFARYLCRRLLADGACDLAVTRSVPPHTANQRASLLHRHALLNSWSGVSISQWFDCVKECVEEERSLSTPRKRGVSANSANCVRVGGGA